MKIQFVQFQVDHNHIYGLTKSGELYYRYKAPKSGNMYWQDKSDDYWQKFNMDDKDPHAQ